MILRLFAWLAGCFQSVPRPSWAETDEWRSEPAAPSWLGPLTFESWGPHAWPQTVVSMSPVRPRAVPASLARTGIQAEVQLRPLSRLVPVAIQFRWHGAVDRWTQNGAWLSCVAADACRHRQGRYLDTRGSHVGALATKFCRGYHRCPVREGTLVCCEQIFSGAGVVAYARKLTATEVVGRHLHPLPWCSERFGMPWRLG